MMSNALEVVRPGEAAAVLNLSKSTLAKMRMRGDGPPFAKLGGKIVVYRLADLREWLEDRCRHRTAH
ncbi:MULTISPECIES: helix-turn-helix transcriptional regulator [unclassified Aurantimonas]|uniref:helix-turn-helix transcriptional regulator n=1 Tax=unclassified Aurantimonas TaxID=2638230 RepID=UPI002E18DC96|nr:MULTISPECIES: helix-turn-helix domain-containing protein [unclassified Aurantimonas]MEC5293227.1 helix-turn-helix domain-containing protein [Aurantimonas sp. C2-3-R2]MEC5414326.1 helix-turn-helix domain-containing protein [Aurantimonas sp. C2-4-R8]